MSDLELGLRELAAEVEWPETPQLQLRLEPRTRTLRKRRLGVPLAAVLVALAVALSVPAARTAILRVFHLGGVTVERVDVLPPARERPLASGLGPLVSAARAERVLGAALPALSGTPRLHLRDGVVSVMLATPRPVLLSEFRSSGYVLKKLAGSGTDVSPVEIGTAPGLWIAGAQHVVVFPATPARLAGNVLVWQRGTIVYRLEGRRLRKQAALELAARLIGT